MGLALAAIALRPLGFMVKTYCHINCGSVPQNRRVFACQQTRRGEKGKVPSAQDYRGLAWIRRMRRLSIPLGTGRTLRKRREKGDRRQRIGFEKPFSGTMPGDARPQGNAVGRDDRSLFSAERTWFKLVQGIGLCGV